MYKIIKLWRESNTPADYFHPWDLIIVAVAVVGVLFYVVATV